MAQWADQNARFLHPNRDQVLEIDDDLVASGVRFDQPEFFDKMLADLRSKDGCRVERAQRLLERYVPIGPERRRFRCLGFVVEGKSAIRFCLGRGRLPLVHRSPCKETRRARQRNARPEARQTASRTSQPTGEVSAGFSERSLCTLHFLQEPASPRNRWREQSLVWMKEELAAVASRLDRATGRERSEIPKRLGRWQIDLALVGTPRRTRTEGPERTRATIPSRVLVGGRIADAEGENHHHAGRSVTNLLNATLPPN